MKPRIHEELTLDIKIPTKISFKTSVTVPPPKIPTPQNSGSDTEISDIEDTSIKNEAPTGYTIDPTFDPEYERTFKSGREYDLRDDPDAIVCPI